MQAVNLISSLTKNYIEINQEFTVWFYRNIELLKSQHAKEAYLQYNSKIDEVQGVKEVYQLNDELSVILTF